MAASPYTQEWREWFVETRPNRSWREVSELCVERWGFPMSKTKVANWSTKLGVRAGRRFGCFEKGHATHNKGKRWDEYLTPEAQEKCRSSQFKKGRVAYNPNHKPIGYERINVDDLVEVKVHDGLQTEANCNYRLKHWVKYEEYHGERPKGCNIVFADRDRRNFSEENLVAVPRELWVYINRTPLPYHDRESLLEAMEIARMHRLQFRIECARHTCRVCGCEFNARYERQKTCDACLGRDDG